MKYFLTILFSVSILTVFSQKVTLKGTITGAKVNDTLVLTTFSKTSEITASSIIREDGYFEMSFKPTETYYYRLALSQQNFLLMIIAPGDDITVTADASDLFKTFKTEGSVQTDLFYEANDKFMHFQAQKDSISESTAKQYELIDLKTKVYSKNFILENINSLASLMLIERLDKDEDFDIYKKLDSALTKTYPKNKMVQDFHLMVQNVNFLAVGSDMPEVLLADTEGKNISLSSLKGKYVLIDFWATWCSPCRAEIPNLRRAYKMYNEKGFEIYSISIDRDKDKWKQEAKNMPWITVYDTDGITAKEFGVSSIPHTILIDREGKIVAKGLRGAELNMVLADALMGEE